LAWRYNAGMGPEALEITREEFKARLKLFRGEIKGILTRGDFVTGIGNAYADEILWTARIHPYRKKTEVKSKPVRYVTDCRPISLAAQKWRLLRSNKAA
jgi:formamidopyrimidine-DNA glycosylase